uniref:CASP-like protein n=1 Tax=Salix viminalis TaxID=40686 RepID=A0A6N2KBT4_SALVM
MKAAGPIELGEGKSSAPRAGVSRGMAILDFILRILAFIGTLASAISMATTNETLPFFTQFIRFRAEYNDLSTFTFFVVAMWVVSAYLLFSLPFSIFNITKSACQGTNYTENKHFEISDGIEITITQAMLSLLTAGASAAAAIVYLAHRGNVRTNWFAICQQYNSFCERISGSLIGSFIGVVLLMLLILLSAVALSRHK